MNALAPYLPQWYSLWIIWVLLGLDVLTTKYAIEKLGAHEANPAMALVMKFIGNVPGLLATHVAASWYFYAYFGEIGVASMWLISLMFTVVVGNNFRLILKARAQ